MSSRVERHPALAKQSAAHESPRPLLKWAGGKRQLVGAILQRLPERIDTYYEPFCGGAAVFFALAARRRFRRAVLADTNAELIETYELVRDDVEAVIRSLRRMQHSEESYYRIRDERPRRPARRAARTIFLNRTGYNGLYRVNRSGRFNVPFGRYKAPLICDPERIRAVSRALQGVRLEVSDFEQVALRAGPTDAVYFDPPYVPMSKTANFANYQSSGFGEVEQRRLAKLFDTLVSRRVPTVLSNSDVPLCRELYGAHDHDQVQVRRAINSKATARGPVGEIIVYGPVACSNAATGGQR